MKKQGSNMRFYKLLDAIISGLTVRYEAGSQINVHFSFLLHCIITLTDELLQTKAESFIQTYSIDVSEDLAQELKSQINSYIKFWKRVVAFS